MTVFEDVASERKDHRRVVWSLHDVFVRPCRRISPGEDPRRAVDEASNVVRKRLHRSRSFGIPQPEPFLYSGAFGGRRALPSAFRSWSFEDELKCIAFIISGLMGADAE